MTMKRFVDKSKFYIVTLFAFIVFLNFIVLGQIISSGNASEDTIILMSRIASVELILSFIAWIRYTKEIASPFFLLYCVAVIYCVGQVFGWALGIDLGEKDLLTYGIDLRYVETALLYSLNGVLAFFCGAICSCGSYNNKLYTCDNSANTEDINAINIASKLIFFISLPFLIIYWLRILPAIFSGGYLEYYTETGSFTKLELLSSMIADWFPISLLMIYAININKKKIWAIISLGLLGVYILITLYIGGRSVAVELILAIFLTNQYLGKPMSKKKMIVIVVAGYLLLCLLNVIADTRSSMNRSLASTLEGISFGFVDTIGEFLGEMGWQMSSTSWTMQFIEGNGGYRFGLSYLTAFTVIIPNLGQWRVHPDSVVNAGDWMQKLLGRKTGMGYSFVAESFYNFSWFGIIMLFLVGMFISKWFSQITLENAKYNYKKMLVIIMVFATILRPFVRSTFSATLRKLVYIVLAILFLIYLLKLINKRRNPYSREENYE